MDTLSLRLRAMIGKHHPKVLRRFSNFPTPSGLESGLTAFVSVPVSTSTRSKSVMPFANATASASHVVVETTFRIHASRCPIQSYGLDITCLQGNPSAAISGTPITDVAPRGLGLCLGALAATSTSPAIHTSMGPAERTYGLT